MSEEDNHHGASKASFHVNLFGALTLFEGGKAVPSPALSGTRPLLAYLLLHHHQPHARLALAGQLWPTLPEKGARHALSQAIWRVNRYLPDLLHANMHTVGISSKARLWTDVTEFEKLLQPHLTDIQTNKFSEARTDLQRALQLYRGDLLEGFYEDWVLNERQRLRILYLRALERVIQLEKLAGDHEQALAAAQTLVNVEPLQEVAQREIMRLNSILGHPEAALEQFATYSQILENELGLRPEPETLNLAREIAAGVGKSVTSYIPTKHKSLTFLESTSPDPLPLVGRRDERAELAAWVESTCRGAIGVGLLEGEAGIGKTRLLQEVGRDAEWRGIQVLWGKGKELEAASPYEPLLKALDSGLSPLRVEQITSIASHKHDSRSSEMAALQVLYPLLPALASTLPNANKSQPVPLEPAQEHTRLVESLAHLLLIWGQITPLVLILEDLHWATRDTLDTLINLAEQLPTWAGYSTTSKPTNLDEKPQGILIIASYRGEEARAHPEIWDRLQKLDRLSLHGRLNLDRLDATATSELVNRSLGMKQPAPLFEARLYANTQGNPLFVLETLRYLYGEGLLWRDEKGSWNTDLDDSTSDYSELPLSPVIERMIAHRLEQLPAPLLRVLNAAAVLGNHFDFSMLMTITGLDTNTLPSLLTALIQRGFVCESAQGYRFQHDKMRQVVYENLPEDGRMQLHRRAGQALEHTNLGQIDVLAHHWTLGQVWERAIACHQSAAEAAQSTYAYATALEHLNMAIQLLEQEDMPEKHIELLTMREATLGMLNDLEAQVADLDTILALLQNDPLRQVQVLCRKTEPLRYLSRYDEAEAAAQEALDIANLSNSKTAQVTALLALGDSLLGRMQPNQAIHHLRQAVKISQQQKDLLQRAKAHKTLATACIIQGQCPEALTEAELSLALYQEAQDRCGQAQILGTLSIIHSEQGEAEKAILCCEQALQISHEIGYRREETRILSNLGNIFWERDQPMQAIQAFNEALYIAQRINYQRLVRHTRINLAALKHYLLGDDNKSWDELQAMLAFDTKMDHAGQYEILEDLGDIARCRGDFKTAHTYLEAAIAGAQDSGLPNIVSRSYFQLARLALEEDDPQSAWKYLESAREICEEIDATKLFIELADLRGLTLLAIGQPQAALDETSKAMEYLTPNVRRAYLIPFHHSQVLSALGQTQDAYMALEQAYLMLAEMLRSLPPTQQQMSWKKVPEHNAILTAWQSTQLPPATVRLPRANAPTGRPLRDDEWIDVHWTVTTAEDESISNKMVRRNKRLLRLLRQAAEQGAAPTVEDLATALKVSSATIKRDLARLRRSGHSINTRGSRGDK